jgi:hypothetical protein
MARTGAHKTAHALRQRMPGRKAVAALGRRILGLPDEDPRGPRNEMRLIGVDVAAQSGPRRAIGLLSVVAAVLVVALGVSSLRIDLLRIRYALGEAIAEEQRLLEEQRTLTAEMRRLRDPVQLAERARRLGFVRPEELIDLPEARSNDRFESGTVLADLGATSADTLVGP